MTLRHRVHQPALPAVAVAATAQDTHRQPPFGTELLDGEALTVRVTDPVDVITADQLSRDLSAATHGGVVPLTLDLCGVTLLAGAGVRTLYDTSRQLAAHQHRLTLVTAPASPAALILDLVDLPYVTSNA
ncbi:STAS domain-containing protein [Actinocrispum sp. NPDC049592]|uniref:STAS domain-containing protein n=1 Tax=Actinocrispum sp. NPDC049592 TaxID=3154835 RepID=UPI0034197E9E